MNIIRIAVTGGVRDPVAACAALILGHVGERGVTQVELDYSAWVDAFGLGTVSLEILRSGDDVPYLAQLAQNAEARVAVWTVSDVDTGKYGYGYAGFVYTVNNMVKKSEVFSFFVDRDVGTPGPPPDPYEGTIALIRRLMEESAQNAEAARQAEASARQAAEQAASASAHPPVIDGDGTWLIWDPQTGRYEDTDRPSAGEAGFSPTAAVERVPGAQRVTITDASGAHTFLLFDAFGREGAGVEVTDGAGGSWYIPEGEGPEGSVAVTDGESVWYFPTGQGAGADAVIEDGAGSLWYMPGKTAGGSGLPPGGTDGQYLRRASSAGSGAEWADLPAYEGAWSVTPQTDGGTTLETAQTYLDRDIVVQAIPYAEVSNISGGLTATIGG